MPRTHRRVAVHGIDDCALTETELACGKRVREVVRVASECC
jgi:hypothetical protein